jgi:hypothetical protein
MPFENEVRIVHCVGVEPPLATLWPAFKFYE